MAAKPPLHVCGAFMRLQTLHFFTVSLCFFVFRLKSSRNCVTMISTNQNLRRYPMKRNLGIARCGLACCLCSENEKCGGCTSEECPDKEWCENRRCSLESGFEYCYECEIECRKGLLSKIKPYAFTLFIKRYGVTELLYCLEKMRKMASSIIAAE